MVEDATPATGPAELHTRSCIRDTELGKATFRNSSAMPPPTLCQPSTLKIGVAKTCGYECNRACAEDHLAFLYFVIRWDLRGRARKIKQKGIPPGKHFMCPDIFYTGVEVKRESIVLSGISLEM